MLAEEIATDEVVLPPVVGRGKNGQFVKGNRGGAVFDRPRFALSRVAFRRVTPKKWGEMIDNMIQFACNSKMPNASIKAFSILSEVLGLKQLAIEVTNANRESNPEQLRIILLQRTQELFSQPLTVPSVEYSQNTVTNEEPTHRDDQ